MREDARPDGAAELRATTRTNLFLAATLHASDAAHPVKIRDLSEAGAQIESSMPPDVGSVVTLARGHLRAQGHVTWRRARRFGLRFTAPISVPAWMANPLNRQQQRVDQAVVLMKEGAVPIERSAQPIAVTPALVAEDLRRVSRLLENLGDALASDPTTVVKHGIQLQHLDIALQTLAALAESVGSDDAEYGPGLSRLADLRTSCAEALRSRG